MESELRDQVRSNDALYYQIDWLQETFRDLERRSRVNDIQVTLDRLDAAEELEYGAESLNLARKMKAAGIGKKVSDGRSVLARIKRARLPGKPAND